MGMSAGNPQFPLWGEKAVEEDEHSRAVWRVLFDSHPQPMWVFDTETLEFLAVNEAAIRHYGYSREEFLGMTIKDIRPPEAVPALMEKLDQPVEAWDSSGVWIHCLRDGSRIEVVVTTHEVPIPGRPARLVQVEDVTERERERARLEDAEQRYRALVEAIPVVAYVDSVDEVSSAVYTSPQIKSLVGYTPQEWIEDPELWVKLIHPEDRTAVLTEHVRTNATGDPFRMEYRLIRRDGQPVWVLDEAVVVRNESGKPQFWQGVIMDISDRKRAEEELQRNVELLRKTDEERRKLLARMVGIQEEERRRIAGDIHDDSIPVLTALELRLEMLRRHFAGPEPAAALAKLEETLTQAIGRLRYLLFELRPPALDREGLAAALRAYLEEFKDEPRLSYRLENRLDAEPDPETRAMVYRIVQEALANVRKHAEASTVEVLLEPRGDGVGVTVRDDGRGFRPDEVVKALPAHLGLTSMRERAEIAGGWCEVKSLPGSGTTVEFWIPREPAS
jgi:PAS domain S-box-containing protein